MLSLIIVLTYISRSILSPLYHFAIPTCINGALPFGINGLIILLNVVFISLLIEFYISLLYFSFTNLDNFFGIKKFYFEITDIFLYQQHN